jgi:hypothetical protein
MCYTKYMTTKSTKNTPEQLRQRLDLRRSGAAGSHADRRDRRNRTRAAATARAIKEHA